MIRVEIVVLSIVLMGVSPLWSQNLSEAVHTSNVGRVKTLLESGANANTSYENRITPIYFASSPEVVDLLLAHGAKLDIRDAFSIQLPIESAAEKYFYDKENRQNWKIIVGKIRDAGSEYTIDTAIYMNDINFVREQLATDTSWVNNSRKSQSSPLLVAASTGRVDICRLLLDPNTSQNDVTAIQITARQIHPNTEDKNKEIGRMISVLMEYGANLDLFSAVAIGDTLQVARLLQEKPTLADWSGPDGYPALHFAVGMNFKNIVKLLLAAGCDLEMRNKSKQTAPADGTALHCAAFWGRYEIAKRLIDAGADVNALSKTSGAPLHEAASQAQAGVSRLLLRNGAKIDSKDGSGKTPLEVCRESTWNEADKIEETIRVFREFTRQNKK